MPTFQCGRDLCDKANHISCFERPALSREAGGEAWRQSEDLLVGPDRRPVAECGLCIRICRLLLDGGDELYLR